MNQNESPAAPTQSPAMWDDLRALPGNAVAVAARQPIMKLRNYFPFFRDEGEVIAAFGRARLVRFLNGKYELRGGTREDRTEAHEWISLFMNDVVIREA